MHRSAYPAATPETLRLVGATLLASLLLLNGCPTDEPAPPELPADPVEPEVVDPELPRPRAHTASVVLTEFEIDMPETLPVGRTIFEVTNQGQSPHNFAIEGELVDERFATELDPGDTWTLAVDLHAGTYRIFCPVGDHAERGMQMNVIVE